VMMDQTWSQACAGAPFLLPCTLWAYSKNDQVTKWQIEDNMIGGILKVGHFYQENFSMHDRV
jgi:hypothetical protein